MNFIKTTFFKSVIGAASIAASMTGLSSCDTAIYEDLDPCVSGIEVRFIYDYNMLFANAFPSQVDCLTLFVYDDSYNYVTTFTETSSALADENYRLRLDLPAGDYHLLAYGGMQCPESSFHFSLTPAEGSVMSAVRVGMNNDCIGADPGKYLHGLFYGTLDVTVPEPESTVYTSVTLPMMKDTNDIRIMLQHADGSPVDHADFNFAITGADNSLLDYRNDIIPTGDKFNIMPWTVGNAMPGINTDGTDAIMAFAEFSTSRLMPANGMNLVITARDRQEPVISIPLVNYLLMLKSEKYASMPEQEYLDRENYWAVIFFLDKNNNWLKTNIIINDWVVRLNTIG